MYLHTYKGNVEFFAFAFKLDVRDFALFRSVKKEGEVLSAGYSLPCTLKQIFLQTKKLCLFCSGGGVVISLKHRRVYIVRT